MLRGWQVRTTTWWLSDRFYLLGFRPPNLMLTPNNDNTTFLWLLKIIWTKCRDEWKVWDHVFTTWKACDSNIQGSWTALHWAMTIFQQIVRFRETREVVKKRRARQEKRYIVMGTREDASNVVLKNIGCLRRIFPKNSTTLFSSLAW